MSFFVILGGMGTLATESFLRTMNAQTEAKLDQDYLDYILVNHATIPDRTAFIQDHTLPDPGQFLAKDIKMLLPSQPDFFVIPCNTAHYFYYELAEKTDIPILNMPRLALAKAKTVSPKEYPKIAVLATDGTVRAEVYGFEQSQFFPELELVYPGAEVQAQVMKLIYDTKENNKNHEVLTEIIKQQFLRFHVDAVILACTELSLLYEDMADMPGVVDAQVELAQAAIKKAKAIRHAEHRE